MFETALALRSRRWSPTCARLEVAGDDAGRVEQIRELEELKRAASAAQVRVAAELVASQRAEQVAAGVPNRRAHRGVGEQVALARGESPHRGGTFVGMATALVHEMPCTMAALSDGRITEWAATCLVRETAVLQVARPGRGRCPAGADAERGGDLARGRWSGPRRAWRRSSTRSRRWRGPPRRSPTGASRSGRRRTRWSTSARCCRSPRAWRSFAALRQDAARAAATGDPRSRGQVMADAFVARVTGRDPVTEPVRRARRPGDDRHHPARPRPAHRPRSAPAGRCPSRSPDRSPAPWSPAPVPPGGPGCGGSTPPPTAPPWSRWTPAPGASPTAWPAWSSCPTSPAAPRGATPRSPRPTTSRPTPTTAPPPARTPRASADAATSPSKHPAGPRSENPTAPSPPPPRPGTPTPPTHHRSSATHDDQQCRTGRPAQPRDARVAPPHGLTAIRSVRRPARPRPTGRAASRRPGRASRRPTPRAWRSRWRRAGR